MFKTTKQSLTDYQVTKDEKHYAWIRKEKDGLYTVVIREFNNTEYKGFRYLKEAKEFVIS